jgi:hypothetical protein
MLAKQRHANMEQRVVSVAVRSGIQKKLSDARLEILWMVSGRAAATDDRAEELICRRASKLFHQAGT